MYNFRINEANFSVLLEYIASVKGAMREVVKNAALAKINKAEEVVVSLLGRLLKKRNRRVSIQIVLYSCFCLPPLLTRLLTNIGNQKVTEGLSFCLLKNNWTGLTVS